MAATETRKGGKNISTSVRRKERYTFYRAHSYAQNKLKRILKSSGINAARTWARGHACEGVLAALTR